VDEGALAGVELSDDHQEEDFVELFDRPGQGGLLVRSGVDACERGLEPRQNPALCREQLVVRRVQDLPEHGLRIPEVAPRRPAGGGDIPLPPSMASCVQQDRVGSVTSCCDPGAMEVMEMWSIWGIWRARGHGGGR